MQINQCQALRAGVPTAERRATTDEQQMSAGAAGEGDGVPIRVAIFSKCSLRIEDLRLIIFIIERGAQQ